MISWSSTTTTIPGKAISCAPAWNFSMNRGRLARSRASSPGPRGSSRKSTTAAALMSTAGRITCPSRPLTCSPPGQITRLRRLRSFTVARCTSTSAGSMNISPWSATGISTCASSPATRSASLTGGWRTTIGATTRAVPFMPTRSRTRSTCTSRRARNCATITCARTCAPAGWAWAFSSTPPASCAAIPACCGTCVTGGTKRSMRCARSRAGSGIGNGSSRTTAGSRPRSG